MKKARLILSVALMSVMGLSTLTLSSCSKDDDCPVGMTGSNCDQELRAPMLGLYDAIDENVNDATDVQTYVANVTQDPNVLKVQIGNFGNFFSNTELVISDLTFSGKIINFNIPVQQPDNVYSVSGQGSYDGNSKTLTITYRLRNDAGLDMDYTGTWTKKN